MRLIFLLNGGPTPIRFDFQTQGRMALGLKDPENDSLARRVATLTGESLTEAVRGARRGAEARDAALTSGDEGRRRPRLWRCSDAFELARVVRE